MKRASLSAISRAAVHLLSRDCPSPDFFSGALLGNGGMGAVVTTRPDSIAIHFGHNEVWDIRIAEEHKDEIGTFQQIFDRVMKLPAVDGRIDRDPWLDSYCRRMAANYRKPYPRPFPCGTLILGFDRREAELLGHSLDISNGICTVFLLVDGKPAEVRIFVELGSDVLWLRYSGGKTERGPSPFNRIRLLPDPDGLAVDGAPVPQPEIADEQHQSLLSFRQLLPAEATSSSGPGDRAFRITAQVNGILEPLGAGNQPAAPLVVCVSLVHGPATSIQATPDLDRSPELALEACEQAEDASRAAWSAYWEHSAVALDDRDMEAAWYRNNYFLRCAVAPGVTCPGLFGNWSYRGIGTAWHGDYHMNYNTQQAFWGVFTSNHPELHLPYVSLVERLLPVGRRWAHEYYGLRGAAFPHSAYPVEMTVNPYPVPTWGWEICETPWTVQSLWWHYRYTLDRQFLEQRAFGPLREAVLFLVDYLNRDEATGEKWGDDRKHVFPTVAPELYGLTPGLLLNRDCLTDLTLIRFVLSAYLQACSILDIVEAEGPLVTETRNILDHLPELPTADTPHGQVFVSVPGENPEITYNVPIPCMSVFPGEEDGLDSPPERLEAARRTYLHQKVEGGNDLVFVALQGARLGLLDLQRLKRQICYCTLPNGTCTDMVLQGGGRYRDDTPYDFMAAMGVWVENFGLPAVINECLLQSYNGTIRLFPNWSLECGATFRDLRAVGAFLVSAECRDGEVTWVEIESEAGSTLRLVVPWRDGAAVSRTGRSPAASRVAGGLIEVQTAVGERLRLTPDTEVAASRT